MKIIPDKKYPNMWRVQWPDGTVSVNSERPAYPGGHYGFYNKTRAKEFLYRGEIENYTLGRTYNAPTAH